MKFVWQLIFLLFIVFSFSLSSYGNFNEFSSSPIFVFSVFNIIICAIIVKCESKSAQDFDGLMAFFGLVYEEETEEITYEMYSDSDDDADAHFHNSDGYDSEIEWTEGSGGDEDEDDDNEKKEYDENLESRIEEFIAKVIKGWREEILMEKSLRQAKESNY